jgi:hypothetical protein
VSDQRDAAAYLLTQQDLAARFLRVESLSETEPAPIVRAVRDNTKDIENLRVDNDKEHQSIRRQVYFFLAAVAGAVLSAIGIRYGALG